MARDGKKLNVLFNIQPVISTEYMSETRHLLGAGLGRGSPVAYRKVHDV